MVSASSVFTIATALLAASVQAKEHKSKTHNTHRGHQGTHTAKTHNTHRGHQGTHYHNSSTIATSGYNSTSESFIYSPTITSILTTPTPEACQTRYGQCGGENWDGPTCCAGDNHCESMNPFYYQCISGSPTTTTPPATTTATYNDAKCQIRYGQCGGENWDGPTCCKHGNYCQSMNPWYYQCISGTPTTTAAPSVTTTLRDDSKCQTNYGQCGGENYEGPTCCKNGHHCESMNPWYYQCVTGVASN